MNHKLLSLTFVTMALAGSCELFAAVQTLPEGVEASSYSRTATAIRPYGYGSTIKWTDSGVVSDVAINGTDIYVRNFIGNYMSDYVQGTVKDDKITFVLPQTLKWNDMEVSLVALTEDENEGTYHVNAEISEVTFNFDGTDFTATEPFVTVGMVDAENTWVGYAYEGMSFVKVNTTLIEAPVGGDVFDMAVTYENDTPAPVDPYYYTLFHAVRKDNTLYLQGLCEWCPDSWV
ncbi:MAG: hypothetical protein K2H75_09170, partial [Muribaculaceae bacterium]|nr:hypothetical protein [Muribaculaceae bacterium]